MAIFNFHSCIGKVKERQKNQENLAKDFLRSSTAIDTSYSAYIKLSWCEGKKWKIEKNGRRTLPELKLNSIKVEPGFWLFSFTVQLDVLSISKWWSLRVWENENCLKMHIESAEHRMRALDNRKKWKKCYNFNIWEPGRLACSSLS